MALTVFDQVIFYSAFYTVLVLAQFLISLFLQTEDWIQKEFLVIPYLFFVELGLDTADFSKVWGFILLRLVSKYLVIVLIDVVLWWVVDSIG